MKRIALYVLGFFISVFLVACAGIEPQYQQTAGTTYPSRGENCTFDILTNPPHQNFKELGIITFKDVSAENDDSAQFWGAAASGKMNDYEKNKKPAEEIKPKAAALTIGEIKDCAGPQVCRNGGNGLILSQPNSEGKYQQGTVILIEKE